MTLPESLMHLPRRRVLGLGVAGLSQLAGMRSATARSGEDAIGTHFPFGPVAPGRPAPTLRVTTHAGLSTDLGKLLDGRVTAIQLMFTGCSATCPIDGALFAQAQVELGNRLPEAQFVSLSIDPLSDTPARLAAWLHRFDARPGWLCAVPCLDDVDRLFGWVGEGGTSRPQGNDPHSGRVYIVDRSGALTWRTAAMPPPGHIVAALRGVAAGPDPRGGARNGGR